MPIARELGCTRVLLPSTAGALSACGAMYADIISEFSVSRYAETAALDFAAVNEALAMVEARGEAFLARSGRYRPVSTRIEFLVAARYRQQVWELDIPLAGSRLETEADVARWKRPSTRRTVASSPSMSRGSTSSASSGRSRATAVTAKPSVSARAVGAPPARQRP